MNLRDPQIVRTSGTCGGKARIAGHRVRVLDIVIWHEDQGISPDEIVFHIPSITVADVQAALAYYSHHVGEIRAEIQHERALEEAARRKYPSLVQAKLEKKEIKEAS